MSSRHQSSRPCDSLIREEIRQGRPFLSPRQEATVALLRTASVVSRALERVVTPFGLSLAQYNALRIIGGAGTAGIPTLAIRERMIEEGTTITRLLDKLESAGFISRERQPPDLRQVICLATPSGRRLLKRLDPIVDASDVDVMRDLGDRDVERLISALDRVRTANAERGAPRPVNGPSAP